MRKPARALVRAVCRMYPFYSGGSRLPNTRLLRALHGDEPTARATLRDGSALWVQPRDFVGGTVYYMGDYDPKITWVLRKLLRPGDTFFDIGANVGLYSILAARLVGPRGIVHSFEPQPDLAEMIVNSARDNGWSHVRVHRLALSNRDTQLEINIPLDNRGGASFAPREGPTRKETVPVREASACFEELNVASVRLVKIDVEGYEHEVLEGAERFFRKTPPQAVVFETQDWEGPFWERRPVKILQSLGYELFDIPKVRWRMCLRHMRPNGNPLTHSSDALALFRGPGYDEATRALGVA